MRTIGKIGLALLAAYSLASGSQYYKTKDIRLSPAPMIPFHGELSVRGNDTFEFYVPPYPLMPSVGGIDLRKGIKANIILNGDSADYYQIGIRGDTLKTRLESKYLDPLRYVPRFETTNSLEELVKSSQTESLFKEGVDVFANGKFFHIKATLCLDKKRPVIEYKSTFKNRKGKTEDILLYAEYSTTDKGSIEFNRYILTLRVGVGKIKIPVTVTARPVKS
jgi:hypothetical protein